MIAVLIVSLYLILNSSDLQGDRETRTRKALRVATLIDSELFDAVLVVSEYVVTQNQVLGKGFVSITIQERALILLTFKQLKVEDASEVLGSGLGLSIAKSIIELHGGKIGVDSVEGKGSTFWFSMPKKHHSSERPQ